MRFHQSESAFFVLITVILLAGLVTAHAYSVLAGIGPMLYGSGEVASSDYLGRLLSVVGVLLATALFFGMLFIYPQIRG